MLLRLLSLALLFATAGCFAPTASVRPAFTELSLDGSFAATETGASVSSSLEELGLSSDESLFFPRADLRWGGAHLSIEGYNVDFAGAGVATANIELDGQTITAGTAVDTAFGLSSITGILTWDIIPTDTFELGLGIGATYVDLDLRFADSLGLVTLDTQEEAPIPMIAARAEVSLGPFDVEARVGLLEVDIDDTKASILDYDASGSFRLIGGDRLAGRLVVGYRAIDVDAEYEDGLSAVDADFEISGPYIGAILSF